VSTPTPVIRYQATVIVNQAGAGHAAAEVLSCHRSGSQYLLLAHFRSNSGRMSLTSSLVSWWSRKAIRRNQWSGADAVRDDIPTISLKAVKAIPHKMRTVISKFL